MNNQLYQLKVNVVKNKVNKIISTGNTTQQQEVIKQPQQTTCLRQDYRK